MTDEAIVALRAAVDARPDDHALRGQLARLLQEAGRNDEALAEAQRILALSPADVGALGVAALAARAMGRDDLAAGYEQLAAALGGVRTAATPAASDPEQPGPELEVAASEGWPGDQPESAGNDELDAFLTGVLDEYERSVVRLDDVAGMAAIKRQVELTFLGPLRNPELRAAYGASLRGGLLLYGPPGCGKTYLARAIAGELAATFMSVGLHDVLDMWLGNSERQLHEIFELARRRSPTVLFFDEVDAIGVKRSDLRGGGAKNVVTQLLTELDGFDDANDGVFVLGATNQPWDVDSALRRPGRFDRTLLVLPPDRPAREQIFVANLAGLPADKLDFTKVAAKSEGFSGADVRLACEAAGQLAMADAMQQGRVVPVSQRHLEQAVRDTKPSTGSWFDVARNAAYFANRDGQYDDLIAYLDNRR